MPGIRTLPVPGWVYIRTNCSLVSSRFLGMAMNTTVTAGAIILGIIAAIAGVAEGNR